MIVQRVIAFVKLDGQDHCVIVIRFVRMDVQEKGFANAMGFVNATRITPEAPIVLASIYYDGTY